MVITGAKRILDVEDAVRWAYGSGELAKRRQAGPYNLSRHDASLVGRWTFPPGFPEISPMFRGAFASGGSSSAGSDPDRPRAPRAAGAPHPDAVAIDERLGEAAAAVADLAPPAELALDLGFALDVAGAVAAAAANAAAIVKVHGGLGKRPTWSSEPPRARAVTGANGKPVVAAIAAVKYRTIETDATGRRIEKTRAAEVASPQLRAGIYEEGAYCKLDYEPDPQWMVNDRAEYFVWRVALEALAGLLSGALETLTVIAPSAPPFPWLGMRDSGKPPVLADGYSPIEALALDAQRRNAERRSIAPRRPEGARLARPARGARGDAMV